MSHRLVPRYPSSSLAPMNALGMEAFLRCELDDSEENCPRSSAWERSESVESKENCVLASLHGCLPKRRIARGCFTIKHSMLFQV